MPTAPTAASPTNPLGSSATGGDLTGQYLGYGAGGMYQPGFRGPRIIPNPFDNTLLVQGTPQEWEQISRLIEQLDVPPRQVLIDAKIYEVDLSGAFSAGVASMLEARSAQSGASGSSALSRTLSMAGGAGGIAVTSGALVLRSHQLLGMLTSSENKSRTKVISRPSIIATDSIPATLNVGQDVPTLTSQAIVGGVQSGGSSVFGNTVSMRSSGITLSITARVNSSGIVTLIVNQDISQPQAPAAGSSIQSPSFSRRSFQTQLTVQDGDTVAIGGIIQETDLFSSGGVPVLHRIPLVGALFGSKSVSKARTELIVFLTPRVIYDTNQIVDASAELRDRLKRLQKIYKEE
jgi:general secretion pathway protein D